MREFAISDPPLQGGVTHAQAMQIHERFRTDEYCWAAPTIANRLGIDYETVCKVLAGGLWPGAYQVWIDRVFP